MRKFATTLNYVLILLLAFLFISPVSALWAQQQEKAKPRTQQQQEPITEGLPQRELTEKERQKREERLRKELEKHFRKWLEEDVGYIITHEEKSAFLDLGTDEEREQFIEQFWLRRDPTPDTIENEFKEEHYRRIAYANERFSIGRPGWLSDRGRIYILHGPPDETESHSAGSLYHQLPREGRGSMTTYAFERWRYRYLEGIGNDIIIEFVDRNGDGDYRLAMDESEKDVFLTPGADPTLLGQMGLARVGGAQYDSQQLRFRQLERLDLYGKVHQPPPVKFKDLEALVETRISFNLLPFDVRLDFLRLTDEAVLVPITISLQKKDLAFKMKDGLHRCEVNVFGRISTLTGRIVQTFEDVIQVDVPPALLAATLNQAAVYQKAVPLRPGLYKLNLVLKDLNSTDVGTLEQRLGVPRFEEGELAHSTLILADLIERVPSRNVGFGQFVVGDTKIRPRVKEQFHLNERMGVYLQVYNLGVNDQTKKPEATIEYSIRRGDQVVFNHRESTLGMERPGQQVTLAKLLPLERFEPGDYRLEITVTDHVRQRTISPSAKFRLLP